MYIDMMKMKHQAHTAMQENKYGLLLHAHQQFLLLYFNFNMHNCARYCIYYAEVLSQIDPLYPRLKDTLSLKALSIKAQYHYPLQTAVDQRGEQTINVMEKLVVVSKCCLFVVICIEMVFKIGNNILYKNFFDVI